MRPPPDRARAWPTAAPRSARHRPATASKPLEVRLAPAVPIPKGAAPIVVGYVGWFGGLAGATSVPSRDAWVAWQKTVNGRGGINGHRVDLLIGDTGGSDARGVSIARDFVENKGAIALSWFSGDATAVAGG